MSQLADLLSRPFAMHRGRLMAFLEQVRELRDLAGEAEAAAGGNGDAEAKPIMQVQAGVAVIGVRGMMLDAVPAWLKRSGLTFADTRAIAAAVRAASADAAVKSIRLEFDSPGGVIGGIEDLAAAVAGAGKPTVAAVDGMCCSAAYWVASQCRRLVAGSRSSEIGSIGVYCVIADLSRMYAAEGVDMHLVSSGGVKGHGATGTPVTPALLAAEQRIIDGLAGQFRAAVARGRGRNLAHLATGETWLADDAVILGLIDHSPSYPEGSTMLDLATLDQLITEKPAAAKTISTMAKAGADESAIRAAIADAERVAETADLKAKLVTTESDLAAQAAAHAEALAAKDKAHADALAAKDAEITRLTELAKHAGAHGRDPGGEQGEQKPKLRSQMTRTERADYLRKNGQAAYDALPF